MRRIQVQVRSPAPEALREATEVLARGGIVAFPTETVYGLAVDAGNAAARDRLYRVKGRDARKACAYLLPSREAALAHVPALPRLAARIADAFWPGPVTLVVPDAEGTLVGLRLPLEVLPRAMAAAAGRPLLQTSANRSGQPAALNAAGVVQALGEEVDLLLDGGRSPGGRASTVVACSERLFTILREGAVPGAEIAAAACDLYLVACTANVCRSPLAAALLRKEAAAALGCEEEDVVRHGYRFESFGIMAVAGQVATDHAITVGREHGVDLSGHASRPFSITLVKQARRVFCLARNHEAFLQPYFHDRPGDLLPLSPDGREIDDPYGRPLGAYRRAAEVIAKACEERIEEMIPTEEEVTPS